MWLEAKSAALSPSNAFSICPRLTPEHRDGTKGSLFTRPQLQGAKVLPIGGHRAPDTADAGSTRTTEPRRGSRRQSVAQPPAAALEAQQDVSPRWKLLNITSAFGRKISGRGRGADASSSSKQTPTPTKRYSLTPEEKAKVQQYCESARRAQRLVADLDSEVMPFFETIVASVSESLHLLKSTERKESTWAANAKAERRKRRIKQKRTGEFESESSSATESAEVEEGEEENAELVKRWLYSYPDVARIRMNESDRQLKRLMRNVRNNIGLTECMQRLAQMLPHNFKDFRVVPDRSETHTQTPIPKSMIQTTSTQHDVGRVPALAAPIEWAVPKSSVPELDRIVLEVYCHKLADVYKAPKVGRLQIAQSLTDSQSAAGQQQGITTAKRRAPREMSTHPSLPFPDFVTGTFSLSGLKHRLGSFLSSCHGVANNGNDSVPFARVPFFMSLCQADVSRSVLHTAADRFFVSLGAIVVASAPSKLLKVPVSARDASWMGAVCEALLRPSPLRAMCGGTNEAMKTIQFPQLEVFKALRQVRPFNLAQYRRRLFVRLWEMKEEIVTRGDTDDGDHTESSETKIKSEDVVKRMLDTIKRSKPSSPQAKKGPAQKKKGSGSGKGGGGGGPKMKALTKKSLEWIDLDMLCHALCEELTRWEDEHCSFFCRWYRGYAAHITATAQRPERETAEQPIHLLASSSSAADKPLKASKPSLRRAKTATKKPKRSRTAKEAGAKTMTIVYEDWEEEMEVPFSKLKWMLDRIIGPNVCLCDHEMADLCRRSLRARKGKATTADGQEKMAVEDESHLRFDPLLFAQTVLHAGFDFLPLSCALRICVLIKWHLRQRLAHRKEATSAVQKKQKD
ncbi:unnamed protein product [Vitrella brassicaformis CCMP3155]|uniref:Uncharacterized protein n=2 Tax=Vitrella brassicaformis TaxID=1169539 RepID=A0A0G4EP66_VITBC|nr:unnamed protein product [Vitrella brassicaformis CCMP3155]|eukprot:CEL98598.1 unnamed protein product [Vitrella brassicaformis CCMP3155]